MAFKVLSKWSEMYIIDDVKGLSKSSNRQWKGLFTIKEQLS
jgi:hypothetical protein